MHIWVDADACPKVIKDILFRSAARVPVSMTLVANKPIFIPKSPHVDFLLVPDGPDIADQAIIREMKPGDLVVTADIPLAALVIEKRGIALNPRGKLYTRDNIGEQLSLRNFMDELRGTGVSTQGPSAFSMKDREIFANQLNQWIQKNLNGRP